MTYAIASDLRARHGAAEIARLADEDDDGAGDGGRIEAALADASSEIDAALARAWDLPLPDDDYPFCSRFAAIWPGNGFMMTRRRRRSPARPRARGSGSTPWRRGRAS